MSQIITDIMPFEYTLDESSSNLKIRGVFQKADTKNENGRVYPRRLLEREVNSLQPIIKERRLLGELGHPQSAEINLERVCHLCTSLNFQNNDVIGEAEVMIGTPYGGILEALLRNNVKTGISSRGKGTTRYGNGVDEVNEDYKMITFDIVSKPSTPGAYPEAVNENHSNKNGIISVSTIVEKVLNNELTQRDMINILKWEKGKKKYFV